MRKSFKKGDEVEIVGNIPFPLKDKSRPLLGTVTNVDGYYILVKPKHQRWEAEFYPNELKHRMKPRRFFIHYNKPETQRRGKVTISVHHDKTCHMVDNVVCSVPTEGKVNKRHDGDRRLDRSYFPVCNIYHFLRSRSRTYFKPHWPRVHVGRL